MVWVNRREEVGVSSRRTVILVAAIVVGALAALALLNYVRGIEDFLMTADTWRKLG